MSPSSTVKAKIEPLVSRPLKATVLRAIFSDELLSFLTGQLLSSPAALKVS